MLNEELLNYLTIALGILVVISFIFYAITSIIKIKKDNGESKLKLNLNISVYGDLKVINKDDEGHLDIIICKDDQDKNDESSEGDEKQSTESGSE